MGAGLVLAVGLLATGLAGCQTVDEGWRRPDLGTGVLDCPRRGADLTVQNPDDVKYYPSDEPLRMGLSISAAATTGLRSTISATQPKRPIRTDRLLGLAASYDRLRRFDLADRAYAQPSG